MEEESKRREEVVGGRDVGRMGALEKRIISVTFNVQPFQVKRDSFSHSRLLPYLANQLGERANVVYRKPVLLSANELRDVKVHPPPTRYPPLPFEGEAHGDLLRRHLFRLALKRGDVTPKWTLPPQV